jgi:hypothetical protein
MDTINNQVWYSGDWKKQNNPKEPYNGVQIIATANYNPITSPPSPQTLLSVDVEVIDYTKAPNGVSSMVRLYKTGDWYDIPIPENSTESPPVPNADFTITSTDEAHLGKQLQLTVMTSGIYLQVQFRYGLNANSEELGFIMKFDETYIEGQDPIQVPG